jgi:hypothetical protein
MEIQRARLLARQARFRAPAARAPVAIALGAV